jgi:hypothetical protein
VIQNPSVPTNDEDETASIISCLSLGDEEAEEDQDAVVLEQPSRKSRKTKPSSQSKKESAD